MNTPANEIIAQQLIAESGISFQCRVMEAFRQAGWTVLLSPYYLDPATDKAREIDLLAERDYRIQNTFGVPKGVRLRLHVECKYISQVTTFWFDACDELRCYEHIRSTTPFPRNNVFIEEHHYRTGPRGVAKLFATERSRGDDQDPIYKALNQVLSGYFQHRSLPPLIPARGHEQVTLLQYPVIVVSDFSRFFRTDVRANAPVEEIAQNFLLETNYAFRTPAGAQRSEYLLTDVVELSGLHAFFGQLQREIDALTKILVD